MCGNASYEESILRLQGKHSVADGKASWRIPRSPKWIYASCRLDPWFERPDDVLIGLLQQQMITVHSYIDMTPNLQSRPLRLIIVLNHTQHLSHLHNQNILD